MARIEHFALFADDAPALKDFYVNVMGMKVVIDNGAARPPGYFLMDDHGGAIELIGRPDGVKAGDTRYLCHVAFTVADVAAERTRLEGLGLSFESDTAVDNAVMQTAFFHDPAGNRCQIVRRATPLGE